MRRRLIPHPANEAPAIAIAVAVRRRTGILMLSYEITGRVGDLALPPPAEPRHADGLWRHSCFEAFVSAETGYYEVNAASSHAWTAYRFDRYREGMREAGIAPPRIETARNGRFVLAVEFALPADITGRLGLSAVIETRAGDLSYWALTHPPGAPDFHHPDGFLLELPASH